VPIEDVDEFPGAADEIHLQFAVFIDDELRCGIQDADAFLFVFSFKSISPAARL